jgi:hypothetical protein
VTEYADLTRGPAWEYRVQRAVFLSGWYVRRGTNLRERVQGSPQTMAEVDILGFGFDSALEPRSLAGECKDRKGGTREADRIVWLLGLSRLLRTDHVLFAKTSITPATAQFARPFGVQLWDEATVRDIELRANFEPDQDYFGSANISLQEDLLRPARKANAFPNRPLRAAWDYLSGAFWYSRTPARTKLLAGYFQALLETDKLPTRARSSFVAEGLIALLVSGYTTAGQLARMSPAQGDAHQETAFASGAADAKALRDIAARADDYYQDALHRTISQTAGAVEIQVPRLANTIAQAPGWLPAYLAFSRRLGEQPLLAGDTLRYADILLFEHCLAEGDVHELLEQVIPSDHGALRTTVQLGALFLQRIWGIDDPLLEQVIAFGPPKKRPRRKSKTGTAEGRPAAAKGDRLFDDHAAATGKLIE